jgi:hypothetical protein
MRKTLKNELMNRIEGLQKNQGMIMNAMLNLPSVVIDLLTQLQNEAISIGNTIEASEKKPTQSVKLLEEYCEILFQVSQMNADSSELKNMQQYMTKLGVLIDSLKCNFLQEISEDPLEVLFLPYKASMWDSLESIYLAACEEKNCHPVVMPIPYYDKNPDQTPGTMHYEGSEFPANIPITNYKEYDIQANMPDIIYIHNPYDHINKVTSVLPEYYAKNLRQYTNKLVYVPYYVTNEHMPAHLCINPAVLYADCIVVQSEENKQTYLEEFDKYGKENHCEAVFEAIKKKLYVAGSPKFDRIINARKEDISMPQTWKQKIQGKRIVLYNTSLQQFMDLGEQYLEKIAFTLKQFKDLEDTVLWWRPHPLVRATLQGMMPELSKVYDQLIKQYKNEDYGIYDDTPDLHRAIVMSDAYYGSAGSLLCLYGITGKPMMLDNPKITKDLIKYPHCIWMEDIAISHHTGWFSNIGFNGLFQMDMDTRKTTFLGTFPEEDPLQQRLYSSVKKVGDKLFFAPMSADHIAIYHIKTGKFTAIPLAQPRSSKLAYQPQWKFFSMAVYEHDVYMIGCGYPAILKIDADTEAVTYLTDWVDEVDQNIVLADSSYFRQDVVVTEHHLYLASSCSDAVLCMNLENHQVKINTVTNKKFCYNGITYDGEYFYLLAKNEPAVIRTDREFKSITIIDKFPDTLIGDLPYFTSIRRIADEILLLPAFANQVLKLDQDDLTMTTLIEFGYPKKHYYNVIAFWEYDNKGYMIPSPPTSVLCVTKDGVESMEGIHMNEDEIEELADRITPFNARHFNQTKHYNDCIFYENENADIKHFIKYIASPNEEGQKIQRELFSKVSIHMDGTAGREIFKSTKA